VRGFVQREGLALVQAAESGDRPAAPVRSHEEKEVGDTPEREAPLPAPIAPSAPQPNAPGAAMFRLAFLGSVEVDEGAGRRRRRRLKKTMVEEAVAKIKVRCNPNLNTTQMDPTQPTGNREGCVFYLVFLVSSISGSETLCLTFVTKPDAAYFLSAVA